MGDKTGMALRGTQGSLRAEARPQPGRGYGLNRIRRQNTQSENTLGYGGGYKGLVRAGAGPDCHGRGQTVMGGADKSAQQTRAVSDERAELHTGVGGV